MTIYQRCKDCGDYSNNVYPIEDSPEVRCHRCHEREVARWTRRRFTDAPSKRKHFENLWMNQPWEGN